MDGILNNKECILKQIFTWLEKHKDLFDENFSCDFHIDRWIHIESKTEWLNKGIALYSLLKDSLGKSYPHLKVMIAFYLSSTHQTRVPQSLSKRNFGKRAYTPPVIFLFSDKRDEKSFMGKKIFSLPKISAKYKVEAYYCEEKEDVVYRTIFMLN